MCCLKHLNRPRAECRLFTRSLTRFAGFSAVTYLAVSQSEGDMVKLVNISRFDGCCYDLGVDSDFPCSCIARVVGDTWVAAGLEDVADAVISHKHH